MQRYEFKVIPAPRRGEKQRGVKATEDRFALALTKLMNEQAGEGWEYLRAESLPCDERVGFTGSKTTYQNLLVFRREIVAPVAAREPRQIFPEWEEEASEAPVLAASPALPAVEANLRIGAATAPQGASPSLGPAKGEASAE